MARRPCILSRLWRNIAFAAVALVAASPLGCFGMLSYERARFDLDRLRGMSEQEVVARFGPPYEDSRKFEPHPREFFFRYWGFLNLNYYYVIFRDGRVHEVREGAND